MSKLAIKKGLRYAKNIGLVVVVVVLSMATFSEIASAIPVGEVQLKSTNSNVSEGCIRYQISLIEDDNTYTLSNLLEEDETSQITPIYGQISGNNALVVVDLPIDTTNIKLKNSNGDFGTIVIDKDNVTLDNDGPNVDVTTVLKYSMKEGVYIQGSFQDATKIYKIADQSNRDRVILKEKEREKEVTIKYLLEEGDTGFVIYDILGNGREINLDDIKILTTFNAKNIDGTKVVIDVTRSFEDDGKIYNLTHIDNIANDTIILQDDTNDIYTNISGGTTKFMLTYTNRDDVNDTKTITVPLILDVLSPVGVKYQAIGSDETYYDISESATGTIRAYRNNTTLRGIIEIRDVQSGIASIDILRGEEGNYEVENNVYMKEDMLMSVLHCFTVTADTTAVRVTDGLGNVIDVPLAINDNVTLARIEKNGNTYTIVAQDKDVGLWKITRGEEEIINLSSEEGVTYDEVLYEQYPVKKLTKIIDIQGIQAVEIYDAVGNVRYLTFDNIAFACQYATYNKEQGSLSLNITEDRGIWKVTYQIVDSNATEEPVEPTNTQDENYEEEHTAWEEIHNEWESLYRHTYTLQTFPEDNEPVAIIKTYEIPEGTVEKITVYNTKGDNELYVVIDNTTSVPLIDAEDVAREDRINATEEIKDNQDQIIGAKVAAKYGIKTITYSDGTIITFQRELPTELVINCLIGEEVVSATVKDGLGDSLQITSANITPSYE